MNLILFAPDELERPLPRHDRRAAHVVDVLRRRVGDSFDAGVLNGPRGKATVAALDDTALTLRFAWTQPAPPPSPLTAIVGLPRPQTARDILRDATTLGVGRLHFVRTEKSDPGYAQSSLWRTGEWQRQVVAGAEQAFATRVPEVTHGRTLGDALAALPSGGHRIALDNYEAAQPLGAIVPAHAAGELTLAIGSERGWSASERARLREHGFTLAHLGARVLRTETACVAAIAIVRAKLGLM